VAKVKAHGGIVFWLPWTICRAAWLRCEECRMSWAQFCGRSAKTLRYDCGTSLCSACRTLWALQRDLLLIVPLVPPERARQTCWLTDSTKKKAA
jgi:hypothetical protein